MKQLKKLYKQWLSETNKGHYKGGSIMFDDVLSQFGNQDFVVQELENFFGFYNIKMQGNILDIGCSMGGLIHSLYNSKKFDFIIMKDVGYIFTEIPNYIFPMEVHHIIKNSENLSGRFKFIDGLFKVLNKIGLNSFIVWVFKFTKMYPSLWYITGKNK